MLNLRRSLALVGSMLLSAASLSWAQAQPAEAPKPPSGRVVFHQELHRTGDGEAGFVGKGFFAKTPGGTVIGVTSMHFLELEGSPFDKVSWFDAERKPVAEATKAFGTPGRTVDWDADFKDLRLDYLLLKPDADPKDVTVLEFDPRPQDQYKIGERVWFPLQPSQGPMRIVGGEVTVVRRGQITVRLDDPKAKPTACSGSPIISQKSGKVIGLLAAGGEIMDRMFIQIAPAPGIVKAIERAEKSGPIKPLREIDWTQRRFVKPDPTKGQGKENAPKDPPGGG